MRTVAARFVDADTHLPIGDHLVEWFDGESRVAATRTDASGRVSLSLPQSNRARSLEARLLRPHPDPALAPVQVATAKAAWDAAEEGVIAIEVRPQGMEKLRRAGETSAQTKRRAKVLGALALKGESLHRRLGEAELEGNLAAHRAAHAAAMNIGHQLPEYEAEGLSDRLRAFVDFWKERRKCSCDSCESALSPLAYLAHLLEFTTRHVVNRTPPAALTLAQLETHFGQKFSQLTQSCKASESLVPQALIAIEVLENHLVLHPLTAQQRGVLERDRAARLLDAYLTILQRMGLSYDDLRLADTPERKAQVAELLGITADRIEALTLDPTAAPGNSNALNAARLAKLFGFASGEGATAPDMPDILTWRYEALSLRWENEDQPATDELAGAPIIDPDVVGPDDFRNPSAKTNGAMPDGPFDVWLRRRAWLDAAQGALSGLADVAAMLARLYQPFVYQAQNVTAWLASTPVTDFAAISQALSAGRQMDVNTRRLETDLEITPEAFERLVALRRKDELSSQTPPRGDRLTGQERLELVAILTGCLKRRAFAVWLAEERTAGFAADPKHFWAPRRIPPIGAWPRLRAPGEPHLDPAAVAASDLPEGSYGDIARGLLESRASSLVNRRSALASAREGQGFSQCLADGLSWWTIPAGSTALAEFRALASQLATPATAAAALARIESELHLSTDDFVQIVQIDQREQAGDLVAQADYEAVYQAFIGAFRRQQFPTWVAEETVPYWQLLKQKLVPWRTTADDRFRWQQALRAAMQPVVVDPDLLYASDFVLNARAYQLWLARVTEVEAHLASLRTKTSAARATPPTAVERTALDALIVAELQVSSQDLLDLATGGDEGQEVEWRLGQLLLTRESLAELTRVVRLAGTTAGTKRLLEREWEALFSICTQIWKLRDRITAWRDAERTRTAPARPITLSPDFFRILPPPVDVFPPPTLPPLPAWRGDEFARIDWVDKLQSRVDSRASLLDSWRTTLRGAEEIALPAVRDVLLRAAADSTTRPIGEVARELEQTYLIDFRMGGCATTTRVAQAIETIQAFLESLRTSRSALSERFQIATTTTFDFAAFDEDMQWFGTYAAWRSAMYVQLFPENVLSPFLKDHQTYGLRRLVTSLRSTPRPTADDACRLAGEYAEYFNDVMGLDLRACARVNIRNKQMSCTERRLAPTKNVDLLVGLAPSGKVYFATRDLGQAATLNYAQSSWEPIEDVVAVQTVLGAAVYEPQSGSTRGKRSVAVLLKLSGEEGPKLGLISFDLETAEWSVLKELALPGGVVDFDASFITAAADGDTAERPIVEIVPLPTGKAQFRSLNASLADWDGQSFSPRQLSVEIQYVTGTDGEVSNNQMIWVGDTQDQRNAQHINHAAEWAQSKGFTCAMPTFRVVDGKHELIAFDGKSVAEFQFRPSVVGASDSRVNWSRLQWLRVTLSNSDTQKLLKRDEQTVGWLQTASFAARAVAGSGYLAAFPKFELDLPADTPLDDDPRQLPFHIYAFKPSDFVTRASVPHRNLNAALFTNLGLLQSPLAGFHRAVHEYAVAQGYVAGIPTWLVNQGANTTGRPNVVEDATVDPNTSHEVLFFRAGDGLRRKSSSCGTLVNSKPVYPAGQPKFTYYHKPTARDLSAWRALIVQIYAANNGQTPENINYIDEASYFVPMILGMGLHRAGEYDAALEWFRLALDWTLGTEQAIQQSRFLRRHASVTPSWNVVDDWLRDPLHPHLIAATRPRAYTRFTFFAVIRCYLDYADAEYAAENVAKAKRLYQVALDLLRAQIFQIVDPCAPPAQTAELDPEIIGRVGNQYKPQLESFFNEITPFEERVRERLISRLRRLIEGDKLGPGLPKLWDEIEAARAQLPGPSTVGEVLTESATLARDLISAVESHEVFRAQLDLALDAALIRRDSTLAQWDSPQPGFPGYLLARTSEGSRLQSAAYALTGSDVLTVAEAPALSDIYGVGAGYGLLSGALNRFCIPVNPLMRALRLHAEVNIHKIDNCRNIAGMKRALDLYGAPTDASTGLPSIGAGGQLELPAIARLAPTQYRFRFLVERARQLAQTAQQMESAMFSALSQRDAAAYSLFKARQDVRLARSELSLQDLRLTQTREELTLSSIQQERALFQVSYFSGLLNADLNVHEIAFLVLTGIAAAHSAAVSAGYFSTSRYIEGISAAGQAWSQKATIAATLASHDRRRQEWRYQRTLSIFEVSASRQQMVLAQGRVQVATQERAISELRATMSEDTVEFLTNKQFVTEELLDWMVDILEGVYRTMLQQATTMARLASSQLAFERQEEPPAIIQADYWTPKADFATEIVQAPDRKGLTGSARLLSDIEQLAQHALETDRRKLHLTKTLSLAQLAPLEFEQFRSSGVLTIATPMSLFDQDFPGQYLRLIKRVRVSLMALIPPTAGIKATLTASATSRVVVGGDDVFQTVRVQHGPDLVALTSTQNATGVFDFDVQPEMLAPFEGIGVDTVWQFSLPKAANQFEYGTIADVLLTIDYSALFSYEYRQTVIASLRPTVDAERGFSFRHDFADTWYDLHHPELSATPMTVRFRTTYDDFPANLDPLTIRQVALGFSRKSGASFEVPIAGLHFIPDDEEVRYGGAANTTEGVASTRRGNALSWQTIMGRKPCGTWELALPNTAAMKSRFTSGDIENIVLLVGYSGRRPSWM